MCGARVFYKQVIPTGFQHFAYLPHKWTSPRPAISPAAANILHYRQRRKNLGPPLAGTVTCQVVLPTSTGAFVSVVQFDGASPELACTENPALASGQLRTT